MAFVPGFEHDVFVSYAHFDNEPDTQEIRWVSRFQADLKVALRQRLGVDPDIFFDNRSLQNQYLDELMQNARGAAAFIAIMSPSYMRREWTIKELEAFHSNSSADQNRLVPVELLPVPESECHPLLLQVKRAPFYWKDPLEEDIALKLTPKFNPDKYEQRLQGLAHRMEGLLRAIRDRSPKPADTKGPLTGETILLAQVTNDLYDERDQVVAYLSQFGAKILPEGDYKQGGPEFAEAFKADLAQAGLFVQLLGPYRSNRPPDLLTEGSNDPKSYAQFQYDTAKGAGKPVLQWRRPDINPANITHWDKRLLDGPEVLVMGLQEFMKEIKKEIERKNAAAEKEKARAVVGGCKGGDGAAKTQFLFINADQSDKELTDQLLKAFEGKRDWIAAGPLFEGTAEEITKDLDANLVDCDTLLLVYGKADAPWVRAQLRRYSKIERLRDMPPRVKTILFAPPAPKPEIAMSGGFAKIDHQGGLSGDSVEQIVAELRR
jgi:TIR domain